MEEEKKPFYKGKLIKCREVKHSIVYSNEKIPGFYIPKDILPREWPYEIEIVLLTISK